MSFCPKCGRQLADGEVCNCQSQPQMNAQPTSPVFTEMGELVKGIFNKPVAAITNYVNHASAATSCILIAIVSLFAGIRELLYIAGYKIEHPLTSLYEGSDIFTSFLNEVILGIGSAAVFALFIMVLINAFEKDHKITYVQALAVASLIDLVYMPIAIVATVIDLIPVAFFGYLASWIKKFADGMNLIMVVIGIKALEKDDNHMPIVYGVAVCAVAVLSTFINMIF